MPRGWAVSMSSVAAALGFTPMSLYRYVTAKDDLPLLMQEDATGIPPASVREVKGWRARSWAIFRAQLEIYLRHPWMLDIPITGSPTLPTAPPGWMSPSTRFATRHSPRRSGPRSASW